MIGERWERCSHDPVWQQLFDSQNLAADMPSEIVDGCHVSARLEHEGRRAALASASRPPSVPSVKQQPPGEPMKGEPMKGEPMKAEVSQGTSAAQDDDSLLDPATPKKAPKRDRGSLELPTPPDQKKTRVEVERVNACRPAQFGQPQKQQDGKSSKMKGVKRHREGEETNNDDDEDDPLAPPSDDEDHNLGNQ